MLIATDPLSLLFAGCFLFGLLFLLVAALMGSLSHGLGHGAGHALHVSGHQAVHVSSTGNVQAGQLHTAHGAVHPAGQGTKSSVPAGNTHGSNFSLFTVFNPTALALFLLWFGFFGYVFHNATGLVLPLIIILAAAGGIVIAALLLALISRLFGDSEGETVQDVADRVGLLGKVSTTIQENGVGEIIYVSPGGMRKSIPARSLDGRRIERDQEVVVLNYQRGIAEVDTWDHFVNQEHTESQSHVEPGNVDIPDAQELARWRALLEEPGRDDNEYILRKDLQKE